MQVVDNFLLEEDFKQLSKSILNKKFPWYYCSYLTDTDKKEQNHFYFNHHFYEKNIPLSSYYDLLIKHFLPKLEIKSLIRAKANLFTKSESLITYNFHTDYDYNCNAAILYLNDCDGFTVFKDKKIESKANRLLLFNANTQHASTNCTNSRIRANININYF